MNAIGVSLVAFALMVGGALGGALLRRSLPERHLDSHAKDVVRLGAGLVATISGLLLGLLISSANGSFVSQRLEVKHLASDVILMDQLLIRYGPEAQVARQLLRSSLLPMVDEIWGQDGSSAPREHTLQANVGGARLFVALHELSPRNDTQTSIRNQMIQTMMDIAKGRLALFEQADSALPIPFLVILLFWLTAIFASFSLFSPLNPVSIGALLVIAASASGALYLIFELSQPFSGLMQIPRSTIADALSAFGK
jgi:Protein of unknown function (DUF4239)